MAGMFERRRLEKHGKSAGATVLHVGRRTSYTTQNSNNPEVYAYETWKVTLRVSPPDNPEFEVETKIRWPVWQRGPLKAGAQIPVLYDPGGHDVMYDPAKPRAIARAQSDPNAPEWSPPGGDDSGKASGGDDELAQLVALEAAETPAAAPGTTPTANQARLDQLQQLANLHQTGALTDAEFAAEKARILGEA